VNTLSSSPLLGNGDYVAGQISDLGTLQCHYFLCDNLFWFYIIRIECPFNVIFCNYEYLNWEIFFVAAEKLEQAENQLAHSRFGPLVAPTPRKKEVSDVFFIRLLQCTLSNYWNFFIESFRWIIQVFHLFI